jgi:hypothetical protein
MTVDALGATATQYAQPPHGRHKPPSLDKTAELLGMSSDDLRDAQRSGTTLTDLAAQKGVSKDDLVKSIAEDLKAGKPDGAPELSEAQLAEMATSVADGKRPQRPHGGPPPGASAATGDRAGANLQSLADELGLDPADLLEQLKTGLEPATGTVTGGVAVDRLC